MRGATRELTPPSKGKRGSGDRGNRETGKRGNGHTGIKEYRETRKRRIRRNRETGPGIRGNGEAGNLGCVVEDWLFVLASGRA
jgi:hypothetical protein